VAAPVVSARVRAIPLRAFAAVLVLAIVTTFGGSGIVLDSASAFELQSRADTLHARWIQMIDQGVPAADLEGIQRQWADAERIQILSIGVAFWSPASRATIDSWQAETDAIWVHNVSVGRDGALAALMELHRAIGTEPSVVMKDRLAALNGASTPADYRALQFDWDLQARLVPINKEIAAAVGTLIALSQQATALGILSDPAPDVLLETDAYQTQSAQEQAVRAAQLARRLHLVANDLRARLGVATTAKQGFGAASDQLSLASAYGVDVSGFQGRIDADAKSFGTATTVAQFNAITADLNQVVSEMNHTVAVLRSTTHIVHNVSFYYQTHTLSCEEAATSMALTHQGIYLGQNEILAEMGADTRPMYVDGNGTVRWANPYLSFAGNVNGSEHNYSGYGAFYPPLVRVAKDHGASVIAYGSMSAEMIYARLTAGHPVVVWATWDWAWHPRHDYLSFDGQWIPWIGPYADAHVYTAVGVSPWSVLVNDPLRGQYWVDKGSFEAAYSDFGEAIVFA
jgi:uncharacterized protein YvpB